MIEYCKDIKNFLYCLHSTSTVCSDTHVQSARICLSISFTKYELTSYLSMMIGIQHLSPSPEQCILLFSKCSILACIFALLSCGAPHFLLLYSPWECWTKLHLSCLLRQGVTIVYPLDYEDASTLHSWVLYFRAQDEGPEPSKTGTLMLQKSTVSL